MEREFNNKVHNLFLSLTRMFSCIPEYSFMALCLKAAKSSAVSVYNNLFSQCLLISHEICPLFNIIHLIGVANLRKFGK